MNKFIFKVFLFIAFGYMIGEGIVRIFKLTIDIPIMYQDSNHLIKNEPNQTGYYTNGNKWIIKKYGEYGYEPKHLNSLITIIGDSYIENIMNPPECHQAYFLANMLKKYNYYPCARSGASFIEMMEMAKSLKRLKPIKQILYVHHGDFIESISEIEKKPLTVQLSVLTNKISYAHLSSNSLKSIMYNLKFAYFIYRNVLVNETSSPSNNRDVKNAKIDMIKIKKLLNFVKKKYSTANIILVFSPDSDLKLIELVKNNNFNCIKLKTDNYKSWLLSNDSHWSCFGHEEASKQVSDYLKNNEFDK